MRLFTSNPLVSMLKADHKKVSALFRAFKEAPEKERAQIVKRVLQELEVHADLEERLIYPAIRQKIDMDDRMNEAAEEHHVVRVLIRELKMLRPSNERFAAKFNVLAELVRHHVEEEEGEILPKAENSDLDWQTLEGKVKERKQELMGRGSEF